MLKRILTAAVGYTISQLVERLMTKGEDKGEAIAPDMKQDGPVVDLLPEIDDPEGDAFRRVQQRAFKTLVDWPYQETPDGYVVPRTRVRPVRNGEDLWIPSVEPDGQQDPPHELRNEGFVLEGLYARKWVGRTVPDMIATMNAVGAIVGNQTLMAMAGGGLPDASFRDPFFTGRLPFYRVDAFFREQGEKAVVFDIVDGQFVVPEDGDYLVIQGLQKGNQFPKFFKKADFERLFMICEEERAVA